MLLGCEDDVYYFFCPHVSKRIVVHVHGVQLRKCVPLDGPRQRDDARIAYTVAFL